MAKPQQPELRRSGLAAPVDPDAIPIKLEAQDRPDVDSPGGPVPVDNRPGHHPDEEQDKPSGDDFVAKVQAKAAEADRAGTETEPARRGRSAATGRAKATAPTQTSAPKAADRPVTKVTPLTTITPPPPRQVTPQWVQVAAVLAGAPWRVTAEVLKLLRRAL